MKKISMFLVSMFMILSLTVCSVVNAEEQTTYTTESYSTVTDSLQNRADTGASRPMNNPTMSTVKDIPNDYWASMEINACVNEGIIPLFDDGTFGPDIVVKRVDFAQWVLNALDNTSFQITVHNNYSDINESTRGYETILRNDQIGLVYGYTDGEFKPERVITKAETNSIMSHITKSLNYDDSVLENFTDVKDIPKWALHTYEKTVRYGLYVNYPNANEFLPNKDLNRAEAAVLLYRLRNALDLVKKAYKAEKLLRVEHLNVTPLAPANTIQVTDQRLIVDEGNVIKIAFTNRFNSKNYNVGDEINFYAKEDIKTVERTTVFPQGTKFLAEVESLTDPRWLNKNAFLTIALKSVTMPDGKTIPFVGSAFENQGVLISNHWQKPLLWTLGGAVVGTGVGLAVGVPNHKTGVGLAVGAPAGAVGGAAVGLISPGVNFGAAEGDEIYVLFKEAMSIYTIDPNAEE